jgi:RND family efflux transporter MFP subunit
MLIEPRTSQSFGPFTGTVEPRYQTTLGFQTPGRLVSRDANVGDVVTKGQKLASLDPTVARLALASAQADLANAQAQLTNASATEARQRALIKTDSVSQAQVDSAVAAEDTARAKLNQAQASLVKAKEQLGYTELNSDYDGVITNWAVEVGQVVTPGQTVVTVARSEIRDAVFDIPDDLLANTQPGTAFSVALLSSSAAAATGKVREVAPQSDAATRTRRIRLTLTDPPAAFRLGTTVTMTLARGEPSVIDVPDSAIVQKDGRTSVWLVTPDKIVRPRPVELGVRHDKFVTVTSGLAQGERVITAGVHSLSDGQSVKIIEQLQ